ncbi:uncharacterized protein EV422DRAFT_37001 [Fimicolochytrium jonesii]|uniref:uncharacterized protein n=1 Tax=Fimicolochytrium jonesii TaxID=1396493 RepID=UPI0022FDBD1E|nr:uncharacterized protein EV422DRAFT_37001 [Fimicolochytrium jonesii]KAI8821305.1 hypothetical protein EV422DRAFT_37001 [Fimicolochytrium jonesii]
MALLHPPTLRDSHHRTTLLDDTHPLLYHHLPVTHSNIWHDPHTRWYDSDHAVDPRWSSDTALHIKSEMIMKDRTIPPRSKSLPLTQILNIPADAYVPMKGIDPDARTIDDEEGRGRYASDNDSDDDDDEIFLLADEGPVACVSSVDGESGGAEVDEMADLMDLYGGLHVFGDTTVSTPALTLNDASNIRKRDTDANPSNVDACEYEGPLYFRTDSKGEWVRRWGVLGSKSVVVCESRENRQILAQVHLSPHLVILQEQRPGTEEHRQTQPSKGSKPTHIKPKSCRSLPSPTAWFAQHTSPHTSSSLPASHTTSTHHPPGTFAFKLTSPPSTSLDSQQQNPTQLHLASPTLLEMLLWMARIISATERGGERKVVRTLVPIRRPHQNHTSNHSTHTKALPLLKRGLEKGARTVDVFPLTADSDVDTDTIISSRKCTWPSSSATNLLGGADIPTTPTGTKRREGRRFTFPTPGRGFGKRWMRVSQGGVVR